MVAVCLAREETETCSADGTCQASDSGKKEGSQEDGGKKKLKCEDKDPKCKEWANSGECTANPGYMNTNCRRSCELCADQVCVLMCRRVGSVLAPTCSSASHILLYSSHYMLSPSNPMLKLLELSQGADMGVVQSMENSAWGVTSEDVAKQFESVREYLQTVKVSKEILSVCKNAHADCTAWAISGECEKNPKFMKKECSAACKSCEYLSVEGRCPIDPDAPASWGPGDLDKMFVRLTSEPYLSEYSVETLSSPSTTKGPWVITMDNVLTKEEADQMIALGAKEGYKRSSDVGKLRPDGSFQSNVNSGRTSTNAWCLTSCYNNEVAQRVIHRLSNITGIPEVNSEYLQLLRYEKDQFYTVSTFGVVLTASNIL